VYHNEGKFLDNGGVGYLLKPPLYAALPRPDDFERPVKLTVQVPNNIVGEQNSSVHCTKTSGGVSLYRERANRCIAHSYYRKTDAPWAASTHSSCSTFSVFLRTTPRSRQKSFVRHSLQTLPHDFHACHSNNRWLLVDACVRDDGGDGGADGGA